MRVRFAPSPTGPLHIGGVRSALYNYLLARKYSGTFILRIEDTDQGRFVPGAEEYIESSLAWLGLLPDESVTLGGPHEPYRQSERKVLYDHYVQELIRRGQAYYAFDTPEELENMREREAAKGHMAQKYDHTVRMTMTNSYTLSSEEVQAKLASEVPFVIRLRVEPDQQIYIQDVIRGEVIFDSNELDDKVLIKADGLPTYHLANVVDDHLMQITHVVRGEEWLSSTAHHILLYRAFGWEESMPQFAHLPLILKPSGKGKLSKRDSSQLGIPVFPMAWKDEEEGWYEGFKEKGFLPQAVINFLAFLGWNPGTDQEIFSMAQLIAAFGLEQVSKAGARFDYDKALWFNHQYIVRSSPDELLPLVKEQLIKQNLFQGHGDDFLIAFIRMMKERMHTTVEFGEQGKYFFEDPAVLDQQVLQKKWTADLKVAFAALPELINKMTTYDRENLDQLFKSFGQEYQLKSGDLYQLLRLAITGALTGPDLLDMCVLIGREALLRRLRFLLSL